MALRSQVEAEAGANNQLAAAQHQTMVHFHEFLVLFSLISIQIALIHGVELTRIICVSHPQELHNLGTQKSYQKAGLSNFTQKNTPLDGFW